MRLPWKGGHGASALFLWICSLVAPERSSCFQYFQGTIPGGQHASGWHTSYTSTFPAIEGRFSSFAGDVSRCRKKLDVHASTCAAAAQPPPISMTAAASSSSTIGGIRHFFGSSSVSSAMNAANSAPPVYYFLYLLSAGVGVPVSEDALLIFVGTFLGNPNFTTGHKLACIGWCYAGVCMSDMLTYGIGYGFRRGLFNPLRRVLFADLDTSMGDTTTAATTTKLDGAKSVDTKSKKRTQTNKSVTGAAEKILERIRRSGKFVGVAERFAVGARGPMTLLCGFTGVPFKGFAIGVALGALFGTVPIQLAVGHALRDRPAAVGAIGAAFISFYAFGPPIMAAIGGATLWVGQRKGAKERAVQEDAIEEMTVDRPELGAEGAGI